jgi:hypothetical protein
MVPSKMAPLCATETGFRKKMKMLVLMKNLQKFNRTYNVRKCGEKLRTDDMFHRVLQERMRNLLQRAAFQNPIIQIEFKSSSKLRGQLIAVEKLLERFSVSKNMNLN